MSFLVYAMLPFYFLLGAILIPFINKRRPADRHRLWTKYFMYLGIVAVVCTAIWFRFFLWMGVGFVLIGFVEMIFAWMKPKRKTSTLFWGLLVYSGVSAGFLLFTELFSTFTVLTIFTLTVIFDGFSQLCGQLFGKRKLLPRISPEKTRGGFFGGIFFLFLSMLITGLLNHDRPIDLRFVLQQTGVALVLSVLFGSTALCGDLLASKYKRACGVKDYGTWIPGHGGLIDRFDSFMFVSAIFTGLSALAIGVLSGNI